jgi:hypothetical protein
MARAAARTVSVEARQAGAGDMISRSFLVTVTSWRYPPPQYANDDAGELMLTGQ